MKPKDAKPAANPSASASVPSTKERDTVRDALNDAKTADPLLTLGEAARRLGVSERYVRDATRSNRLPYLWIKGVKLILEADLKAFRKRYGLGPSLNDDGSSGNGRAAPGVGEEVS